MSRYALIACVLGAAALGGCQTTKSPSEMSYAELKQYSAALVERCRQEGAKPGAETQACVYQEARADEANRQDSIRRRRAFGVALAQAGNNFQRSAETQAQISRSLIRSQQPVPNLYRGPQTIHCSSRPGMGTVETNCR